ncbi:MAG: 2-dehydropantoate 2-reductase [Anaerolineales bacterium]|nr:2-dehydropantoate 2-reductase [Anaerolineales bacterium]
MQFDPENAILVMGTGALACLFAARLSAAGVSVWMYGAWAEGLQALEEAGVRLVDDQGYEQAYPVQVVRRSADCAGARQALVLVKSWQTAHAAAQLAECLAQDGIALTLQNGMGNREALAQALGARRVSLGVTTIGANLLGPGRVQMAGEGVISVSVHPGLSGLVGRLRAAGFVIENEPDPNALLWGKLVINAAINPITALLRVPNGELLNRPAARQLLHTIVREAAAVAVAQGVRLPYPDPVVAVEAIARRTATNRSSMLQDVLRGAPTEIDAICGAVVGAGEKTGVPTPTLRAVWQLVKAIQPEW